MIIIREAQREDLPQMLEIYNDLIIHTTAIYSYEPHTPEMRAEWFETKKQQGFPIYVAVDENIVLGFATFGSFRSWPGYKYTVENSVYVATEARGKGIGKTLMMKIIEAAKTMNMHAMVAGIDADNNISLKLHEKLGFKQVAYFKEVGFKFGRWLDLIFMELVL